MKKIFLFILFLFFTFPVSVFAQSSEYTIESFDSRIQVKKSGEIQVHETITANFFVPKHGIYRYIPERYKSKDGSTYYSKVSGINVQGYKKDISRDNGNVIIRIGDPEKTLTGIHTYAIDYTVVGVLRGYTDHDELYWNVTGNSWDTTIGATTATVSVEGATVKNTACYYGLLGSTTTCQHSIQNGNGLYSLAKTLSPGDGVTIVTAFPKGVVALPVVQSFGQKLVSPPAIITFLLTLGVGVLGVLLLWSSKGRDLWFRTKHLFDPNAKEERRPISVSDTIVVEYEPPENLRPAEVGVLMDERADTLDVTATIIDLAARGYLVITEEKKKWMFGSTDYVLKKKKVKKNDLVGYEADLYDRLFDTGDEVRVSELKKEFYKDLKAVKDQLYKDMVEKGYFPTNPEMVRNIYLGLAIGIIVVAGFIFFSAIGIENEYMTMFGLGLGLTGLNMLIFSRFMPRRTAKGAEMYRRIKGYRLFISNVEKYRQQFFERENMFNIVLPYAIVFGITAKFAKAMENMGVTPEHVGWYTGYYGAFSPTRFESSMSSFSKSVGTAIASTPGGSGFSSGGGFSGGGFGGGGGGSW